MHSDMGYAMYILRNGKISPKYYPPHLFSHNSENGIFYKTFYAEDRSNVVTVN